MENILNRSGSKIVTASDTEQKVGNDPANDG